MNRTSKSPTRAALLCVIVVLTMLLGAVPFAAADAASSLPAEPFTTEQEAAQSAAGVPEGLTGEEWSSMQAMMAAAEYQVTWQTRDGQEAYRAPNREQGFDVAFAQDGFTALGYEDGEPAWEFSLSLAAYGDTAMPAAIPRENLSADKTTVTYQWDERVSEWFHNTPEGVEHGLTLSAPPLGRQGNEISLAFNLDTDLVPTLSADGQSLILRAPAQGNWQHGPTMLRYDALLVTDAAGRQLSTHLELGGNNQRPALRIVIHAENAVYPLTVDPLLYSQTAILYASDAEADDRFGYAVSISGDTLVVGAYRESSGGTAAGAAYVLERNQGGGDTWGEVTKLTASDPQAWDRFGLSVSISGDTLVVGSAWDDDAGGSSGSAYVYERNQGGADNWGQVVKLLASDAEGGDYFGRAVSISGDTIVVGAPDEDSGGTNAGAAYVFERNQGGADAWGQVAKLLAADIQEWDRFGTSVSISSDTLVVGAWGQDSSGVDAGVAYVFARNQGGADAWGEVAKLAASDAQEGDEFGLSVSISGDAIVVGARLEDSAASDAGSAYVFVRNQGGADNWGQAIKLLASDAQANDQFGTAVSLSGDVLVVGAPNQDSGGSNAGAAYVFERNQGGVEGWGEVTQLLASDTQAGDQFGYAVSISGDTLVAGAPFEDSGGSSAGAAYIFVGSGDWRQIAKPTAADAASWDEFGFSSSINGDTLVVGAWGHNDGRGAAYVFARNTGGAEGWGQVTKLTAADAAVWDQFGWSVSISGDTVIVGALGEDSGGNAAGAAYIFARNQGGVDNWGQVAKLTASDAAASDHFGHAASLSGDTIVIGARRDDDAGSNSGAAYVFARNQGGGENWGQVAKLTASDAAAGDYFGQSVSISRDTLVVGANRDDDAGSNSGSAYVFARNYNPITPTLPIADNWGQVVKLTAADAAADDYFGTSVSISGDTLVVGAWGQDSGGVTAGAAYVFARNQGGAEAWGQAAKLTAADAAGGDNFGTSVSISGDTLVVGAPSDDDAGPGSGSAYILERNQGGAEAWGQVTKLTAADATTGDNFGTSVAISGDTVSVGAPYDTDGGTDSGSAYVFSRYYNHPPVAVDDSYSAIEDTQLVEPAPGVLGNDSDANGDPLTAVLDTDVTSGTLNLNADGSFEYTPTLNFYGVDSFGYQVSDGILTDTAIVLITVTNVNDAPVAVGDSYTTTEDITLDVPAPGVLANDSDVEGDPLTAVLDTDVTSGTLALNADGSFTYTPTSNYCGADNFTYHADDGDPGNVATVSLDVSCVNDPPLSSSDAYTTTEDRKLNVAAPGVLTNDTDVEGDPFTAVLDTGPTSGTLVLNADGSFAYRPSSNYCGLDSFSYHADDGDPGNIATVDIDVSCVNDPPDALDDGYTATEDLALIVPAPGVLLNDSDVEGDPLTAVLDTGPTSGTLTLNDDGSFTYTPTSDFYGGDVFVYIASDGILTATATVVITVTNVNDPPDALDDGYTVAEDSPDNALDLLANDGYLPDPPEVLIINAVGTPSAGGTVLNAGSHVTYTPALDFYGSETFTYTLSDGNGGFDTATVVITVTNTNDPPDALDDGYTIPEDSMSNTLDLLSNDSTLPDPPETLTISAVGTPDQGGGVLNAGSHVTYTPALDFYGTEVFTYTLSDGNSGFDTATVVVTVTNTNDPPDALDDGYTVAEDSPDNALDLLANDSYLPDPPETLSISAVGTPSVGGTVLNAGSFVTYTPALDFYGSEAFTYTLSDGNGGFDTATVVITVTNVQDPPDALDDGYTIPEDSMSNTLDLLSNDSYLPDPPETLTISAVGTPDQGGGIINAGSHVTYTPALDFYGSEVFTYTATDGNGGFDTATVVVTVTNVQDDPVAHDDAFLVDEDSADNALDVLANDADADGDVLSVFAVGTPDQGGTVLDAGTHITYTPALDFFGSEAFTYTMSDGNGGFDTATVAVTVTELGDAPVAAGDAYTTTEDTVLAVTAPGVLENDTDADGDALTAVLDTGPAHGKLALAADGGLVYTPTADTCGTDAFTYHADDGLNPSNVVTVTLDIACINDAPVAAADAYTTTADATLVVAAPGVLSNDTDVEGDTLTAVLDAGPPTGTLLLNADGSFVYTPTLGWSGIITFTYYADDGMDASNRTTVTIEVLPPAVVEYTIYLPLVAKAHAP